jgi:hypothetical protein
MAIAGLITAVWGVYANRRGQRNEEAQARAAERMAERVENYRELSAYSDRIEQQLKEARDSLAESTEKHLAEMRKLELHFDRRVDDQARRCRLQLSSAIDTVHTLQSIVRDEIAKEAARDAASDARRHFRTDHPTEDGEETA